MNENYFMLADGNDEIFMNRAGGGGGVAKGSKTALYSLIIKLTNFLDEKGSFGTCCVCNTLLDNIRCKFML